MSLYTKYRPRDWDSVIGQDAISTVLRTSLTTDHVGHAYILTGSRGTGKTTSARILAKGVNCLDLQANGNPCNTCTHCVAFDEGNMLDCIEIDGASNNGVDNVRDIIEKARFAPNQGKYKIYIIDEVHMLTTAAFNALLKILEEPPDHVKFILATTEINKLPETIRSRSLRFDFKKISEADIVKRLEFVCAAEGITAEKEALEIIARGARGALRDALTLTEQNTVNQSISTSYAKLTLSLVESSLIDRIIATIIAKDRPTMDEIIQSLRTQHAEVQGLFDQILLSLRDRMLLIFQKNKTVDSLEFNTLDEIFSIFQSAYTYTKTIPDGGLLIEITMMRAVMRGKKITDTTERTPEKIPAKKETPPVAEIKQAPILKKQTPPAAPIPAIAEVVPPAPVSQISTTLPEEETEKSEKNASNFSYIRLLEEIKKVKSVLVQDLKTARFELNGNILTFIFSKEWYYNRINAPTMKSIISETLETLYGGTWTIECRLDAINQANIADDVF